MKAWFAQNNNNKQANKQTNEFNENPFTHLNKFSTSSDLMSLRITIGCSQGLAFSNLRK